LVCLGFLYGLSKPCSVGGENELDLISHAAKCLFDFFFRSRRVGGVVEAPVVAVHLPREHRAGLIGFAADGDDGIDVPLQKIVHVFRGMCGNIDPDFGKSSDRLGVNIARGIRSRAMHSNDISSCGAEDALGHVTAAGVPRAKDEDGGLHR